MMLAQEQRIVVLGGSFNPPTIAHLRLMEAAMEAVGAEKGIFVPVGEAYLKRKMRKSEDHIRLSEQMRMDMLQVMCTGRPELLISDLEIQNQLIYTRQSMGILQENYPSAKLYFIAGADKLPMLRSMASGNDFFEHFSIVLFAREGLDSEELVRQDEKLSPFASSFIHAKQPEGVDGISSTTVRKLIANQETEMAYPYLHEGVWKMIRHLTLDDFPPEIERFQGEYEFLSNSYPSPILFDGLSFSCAESAFQAAKCELLSDKKRIAQGDGSSAKSITARIEPRLGWEEEKLGIVEAVLRAKFTQAPELAKKLIATGNAILIYGNNKKDYYWGKDMYTKRGVNHLGQLLMKLRLELQCETERDMQ